MVSRATASLAFAWLALPATQAIFCPAQSKCAGHCGNVLKTTSANDVVCEQGAFFSNPTGQRFRSCVECQRSGAYDDGKDSDVGSMLYNLRFAASYCVWGNVPTKNLHVVDTPCITSKACGPFRDAIQFDNLSTAHDRYQYCDMWPTNDTFNFQGCTDCLQAEGRKVLANSCEQKPARGLPIGLDGEIFSPTAIAISTPSSAASAQTGPDQSQLTVGAKVGISVGVFIGVMLSVACAIMLRMRHRRKTVLPRLNTQMATGSRDWPPPSIDGAHTGNGQGETSFVGYDDTPLSQRPLNGWDDSPIAINRDEPKAGRFSPYPGQDTSLQEMPASVVAKDPGVGYVSTVEDQVGQRASQTDSERKKTHGTC